MERWLYTDRQNNGVMVIYRQTKQWSDGYIQTEQTKQWSDGYIQTEQTKQWSDGYIQTDKTME